MFLAYACHPKMVRLPGWWELPRGSAPQLTADRVFRLRIRQLQLSSTCVTTVSTCILSYAADGSKLVTLIVSLQLVCVGLGLGMIVDIVTSYSQYSLPMNRIDAW